MEQTTSIPTYLEYARSLFSILKLDYEDNPDPRVFAGSTNYWMAGNVFDTAIDYMALALSNKHISPGDVQSVLAYVAKNYDLTGDLYNAGYSYYKNDDGNRSGPVSEGPAEPLGYWYDDFGWWGIACAKAFSPEYKEVFRENVAPFQAIARRCWDVMNNGVSDPGERPISYGAPDVWKKCDQTKFGYAEPLVQGGVWQADINDTYDPSVKTLGPFQNTVVNGLYLVLALRLYTPLKTAPQIESEYKFLETWCLGTSIPEDNRRLCYYFPGTTYGLIMERVSIYHDKKFVNPKSWWEVHTAWGGDQGLILGGLVDYLILHPGKVEAESLIQTILQGVPKTMLSDSIIMPWYPLVGNPLEATDKPDYASGVGVFMRYLLHAYKNNRIVRQIINTNTFGMRDLIMNAANSVVNNKFPKYGNGLFDLFNQLSILITAIKVLQGMENKAAE